MVVHQKERHRKDTWRGKRRLDIRRSRFAVLIHDGGCSVECWKVNYYRL